MQVSTARIRLAIPRSSVGSPSRSISLLLGWVAIRVPLLLWGRVIGRQPLLHAVAALEAAHSPGQLEVGQLQCTGELQRGGGGGYQCQFQMILLVCKNLRFP